MADYTKSQVTAITHQHVTHPATIVGSDQNSVDDISATIICYHANIENVANTNSGSFLIQISPETSNDESWATIYEFVTDTGTNAFEALTATEPAGETVLAVADDTGFAAGDYIYIEDTGTATDSEWALVQEIVAATSITIVDGLTNAKDSSDVINADAESFVAHVDLAGVSRWRVIYMHEGATGADVAIRALATVTTDVE